MKLLLNAAYLLVTAAISAYALAQIGQMVAAPYVGLAAQMTP
jgi:hypothetical protein